MTRHVTAANVMTSGGLVCGLVALLWAADGRFVAATIALALAGLFDALDGAVARARGTSGRFGGTLDSLTDVVAFGAAPALMLARGPLAEIPVVGVATSGAFLVAGAWRLARFSLVEDLHRWIGLPIPAAGLVAAVAVATSLPAWPLLGLSLALTLLMVSEIPIPTAAGLRAGHRRRAARRDPPRAATRAPRREGAAPVPVSASQRRD